MPSETRVIRFTEPEVIEALMAFCETTKRVLPPDGASRLAFPNGPDSRFGIEGKNDGQKVTFYESEVGAALLAYCKRKHIPVARRSTKSLEVKDGAVVLHLVINQAG